MCVWVDVLVAGRFYRSIPVWFSVSAYRVVSVTASALATGTILDARHFTSELREISRFTGVPAELPTEKGAVRLKRALQLGQVLTQDYLEPVPVVARNQDVTVRISAGGIAVEALGVALSDGKLGSMVRVRNPSTKEVFPAEVVEAGVVAVNIR
jgi:flagella basal body P-ring formation protein FlgA